MTLHPGDREILIPRKGVFKVTGSSSYAILPLEYAEQSAALTKALFARNPNGHRYKNEKHFVVADYIQNGRMTRSLANHNRTFFNPLITSAMSVNRINIS